MKSQKITTKTRDAILEELVNRSKINEAVTGAFKQVEVALEHWVKAKLGVKNFAEIERQFNLLKRAVRDYPLNQSDSNLEISQSGFLKVKTDLFCRFRLVDGTEHSDWIGFASPLPAFFDGRPTFHESNLGKCPDSDAVFKLYMSYRELLKKRADFTNSTRTFLLAYSTTARLVADMPDLEPILVELLGDGKESTAMLPAVQLKGLKAMLEGYGVIPV